ncbi:MAG: peroxiredoxin [Euryarchaeota archaeon]|nr:peroxiredoxin [Euryarchaeota archaeon]
MEPVVAKGARAPDFTLRSQDGSLTSLHDLLAKGPVVLYFYPRDRTTNCTTEAKTFRAHHDEFERLGARVVGISSDPPESHLSFCREHRLPFTLLSDVDGKVRDAYGVRPTLGLIPGRETFVIDQDGVVQEVVSSQWRPRWHVEEALRALREMVEKVR